MKIWQANLHQNIKILDSFWYYFI